MRRFGGTNQAKCLTATGNISEKDKDEFPFGGMRRFGGTNQANHLTSTCKISEKHKGEILLTAGGGSVARSRPKY
jgi:hypothetical protein